VTKLIPAIYFYLLSLIGFVLLIIGIFGSVHFITGIAIYNKYPLPNGIENQCNYAIPLPQGEIKSGMPVIYNQNQQYSNCIKNLEEERTLIKKQDLEKALSFSLIGLLVFGIHFYFARKLK